MIARVFILFLLCAGSVATANAVEIDARHELLVVAHADDPDHPTELIGKKELLAKRTCPASTIKVALALMALEEKVIDLKSSYTCSDRTSAPSKLTLQEAMELSSNDFFEQLVMNLGIPNLEKYLNQWKYFSRVDNTIPPPPRITRGKAFTVSPQDEVVFISRVAQRQVEGISPPTYDLLDQAIAQHEMPGLCGKTGSDIDGSWFVAYSRATTVPYVYVLRSDISNSDGKRLKKILLEHLIQHAGPNSKN